MYRTELMKAKARKQYLDQEVSRILGWPSKQREFFDEYMRACGIEPNVTRDIILFPGKYSETVVALACDYVDALRQRGILRPERFDVLSELKQKGVAVGNMPQPEQTDSETLANAVKKLSDGERRELARFLQGNGFGDYLGGNNAEPLFDYVTAPTAFLEAIAKWLSALGRGKLNQ